MDGKWVLTVTPDLKSKKDLTDEICLYLEPRYVKQWLREGISMIYFQRDDVTLEIDLKEITPDWFTVEDDTNVDTLPLEDRIDFYVFTLCPKERNMQVLVEILIGKDKTPADALTGVTLKVDEQEQEITQNGIYEIKNSPET